MSVSVFVSTLKKEEKWHDLSWMTSIYGYFSSYQKSKSESKLVPVIKAEVQLVIPNVVSYWLLISAHITVINYKKDHLEFLWRTCETEKLIYFSCCHQVMIPTVDEIQQATNHLIDLVLEVSKGIAWEQECSHDDTKTRGKSLIACTCRKKRTWI